MEKEMQPLRAAAEENGAAVQTVILDKIRAYRRIMITRHRRPDGDAVGASLGLKQILALSFPEKEIRVLNEDEAPSLTFLGESDPLPDDDWLREALAITVDTGTADRISFGKIGLCPELIRIDHHQSEMPYGDIAWVEPDRSSVSEMIAAFRESFRDVLQIDGRAAELLYAGIVTDSGRFRFSSVSAGTLRAAASLLELGIDTETLFTRLELDDPSVLRYKAFVLENFRMTENGVAWFRVTGEIRDRFGLNSEQASNSVNFLSEIRGSLIWLCFIDQPDGEIRVRLRSRFATVRELAQEYEGGGHACASGATVYSTEQMQELIGKADAALKLYKETHDGWM